MMCLFFFFKQKTAYEMRISDWSSDVCSSDLQRGDIHPQIVEDQDRRQRKCTDRDQQPDDTERGRERAGVVAVRSRAMLNPAQNQIAKPNCALQGRAPDKGKAEQICDYGQIASATCRERGCRYE